MTSETETKQQEDGFQELIPKAQEMLKQLKDLGEKKEALFITREQKRVEDVVSKWKELHPPQTQECPVCLEDIEITENNAMVYFNCCGKGTVSCLFVGH